MVPLHTVLGSPPGYQICRGLPGPRALLCLFPASPATSPLSPSSLSICVWLHLTVFRSVHTLSCHLQIVSLNLKRARCGWSRTIACSLHSLGIPRSSIWSQGQLRLPGLQGSYLRLNPLPFKDSLHFLFQPELSTTKQEFKTADILSYSSGDHKPNLSLAGLTSRARCFWRLQGRICFLSFPLSGDHHILWLVAPFSIFKVSSGELRPFHASDSSRLFFCFPSFSLSHSIWERLCSLLLKHD